MSYDLGFESDDLRKDSPSYEIVDRGLYAVLNFQFS